MSEVTFLISRCIANFRSSRVDGFGAYTMSFKYPHRKKIQWPNAVRPGRNQFITKCFLYRAKNSPNMCGIAPSYWLSIAAGWMPRLRRAGMNLFFSKCKCHSLLSVLTSPSASKKNGPMTPAKLRSAQTVTLSSCYGFSFQYWCLSFPQTRQFRLFKGEFK